LAVDDNLLTVHSNGAQLLDNPYHRDGGGAGEEKVEKAYIQTEHMGGDGVGSYYKDNAYTHTQPHTNAQKRRLLRVGDC
jgi:hypothetical protein